MKEVRVHPDTQMISINEMKLDPGTTYTAMVRTGIGLHEDKAKSYSGTWSDWSSTVKWNTTHGNRDEYCDNDLYLHSHVLDFYKYICLLRD